MSFINCCATCGCETLIDYFGFCIDCDSYPDKTNKETTIHSSRQTKEYYENLSLQQYNTKEHWKDIFVEEELSKLPTFDKEKYLYSCKKQKERDERQTYREAHLEEFKPYYPPPKPQPKCPTCSSTNIQKISDLSKATHALAFGLFSKTARSQFCCKDCGYKW